MRVTLRTSVASMLIALLGLVAATLLVPPANADAPRAAGTINVSRTAVISGESVRVSGALGTRGARPVTLQRHTGTSWATVQRRTSTSSGIYAFSVRQTGAAGSRRAYRVLAQSVRVNGRRLAAVTTSIRKVAVVAQTAVLSGPARTTVGKALTTTATLRPVRTGRVSILQVRSGGAWVDIRRGKQSSTGRTSFVFTPSGVGTVTLRVVAAAAGGAPARGSAPVAVKVLPPALQRVSESSAGIQADDRSVFPTVSASGRYAAFISSATNLVPNDTNGVPDAFVRDLETRAVERVSVGSNGEQATGESVGVSISADGRYVAFDASGSNLVAGNPCGSTGCVYRHDRVTGVTELVSVAISGQPTAQSYHPSISADGTKVAFASSATNLVASDTNTKADIFVRDLVAGTTDRVSVDSDGGQADGASTFPRISGDGGYVAYVSAATDLVPGDTEGKTDVFLWSEGTQSVLRVSQTPEGAGGNSMSGPPAISADGRYVVYSTASDNLVAPDTNNYDDILRWDRVSQESILVSLTQAGSQVFADFWSPAISADGEHVTFASRGFPVGAGETTGVFDIYVRSVGAATTRRISQASSGTNGNDSSVLPAISGDGTVIVFASAATNLVPGDSNAVEDIFARDLTR